MVTKKLSIYLLLIWLWLLLVPTLLMTYIYYLSTIRHSREIEAIAIDYIDYFMLYIIFSGVGTLIGIIVYGIATFLILNSSKKDNEKKYLAFTCLILIDILGLFIVYKLDFGSDLLPLIHIPLYIITACSGFYYIKLPISKESNKMETDINIIDID